MGQLPSQGHVSSRSWHFKGRASSALWGWALVPLFLGIHITQQVDGWAREVVLFQLERQTHKERHSSCWLGTLRARLETWCWSPGIRGSLCSMSLGGQCVTSWGHECRVSWTPVPAWPLALWFWIDKLTLCTSVSLVIKWRQLSLRLFKTKFWPCYSTTLHTAWFPIAQNHILSPYTDWHLPVVGIPSSFPGPSPVLQPHWPPGYSLYTPGVHLPHSLYFLPRKVFTQKVSRFTPQSTSDLCWYATALVVPPDYSV